jgi:hypothetical protein
MTSSKMSTVPDFSVSARSSCRNSRGLMHRLDQNRGELVGLPLQDLERLGRAVVEHQHVLGGLRHDAGRRGHRTRLGGADDHLVEDAVVAAGEERDLAAAGMGAGDAHAAHHRLRAGVAEGDALLAGHL